MLAAWREAEMTELLEEAASENLALKTSFD